MESGADLGAKNRYGHSTLTEVLEIFRFRNMSHMSHVHAKLKGSSEPPNKKGRISRGMLRKFEYVKAKFTFLREYVSAVMCVCVHVCVCVRACVYSRKESLLLR